MENIGTLVFSAVAAALYVFPVILALVLATFAANIFSGLCKPIADPIRRAIEDLSQSVPNPLDKIPAFSNIRQYLGSTKNILFIGFVIIYLMVHYRSLGNVEVVFDNISLLFPGSALDQAAAYGTYDGTLDISSFFVSPENYLREIIMPLITGLFLHVGCTTKAVGAKIHFIVKLMYTMLVTLFSSVVLGKIPPDMFTITFPEISLDLVTSGAVAGTTDAAMMLATLQQWGGILLNKMVSLIPTIVAVYFLCQTVSGFSAAFLGGFVALFSLGMVRPEVLTNPGSFGDTFFLLFALSAGEVVALFFSEFVNMGASQWLEQNDKFFEYYNLISLSLSYFFYPTLVLPVLAFVSFFTNGFKFGPLLISIACLAVFSLVTFVGYKIIKWTWKDGGVLSGGEYAAAMVVNIPIWVIYFFLFMR